MNTKYFLIMILAVQLILAGTVFAAPTANAGLDQTVNLGNIVQFDGSGSSCSGCNIVSYSWNFKDNASGSGINPTHTYASAGIYNVVLLVIDNLGNINTDTVQITVDSLDATPPTITHTPVTSWTNNTALEISATITDNVGVSSAKLHYKINGTSDDTKWTTGDTMNAVGSTYSATIAESYVNTSGLLYYIEASDAAPNTQKSPADAPTNYYNVSINANDTIPPITTLSSVAGDASSPYYDTNTSDAKTDIIVSGENGMLCRYGTQDTNYGNMTTSCTTGTPSATKATCSVSTSEGSYTVYISCKDAAGNEQSASQNIDVVFKVDATAPSVTSASATAIAAGNIQISWSSVSDSVSGVTGIRIYKSTSNGTLGTLQTTASNTTTSWIDTNTTEGATYYYTVAGIDGAGNVNTTGAYVTANQKYATSDATAPTISSVASGSVTSSGATVTWTTNDASDSRVEYGTTTSYGASTTLDSTKTTSHSVGVSGLSASTLYHFRVKSKDAAGNERISSDYNFTTSAASPASPGGGGGGAAPAEENKTSDKKNESKETPGDDKGKKLGHEIQEIVHEIIASKKEDMSKLIDDHKDVKDGLKLALGKEISDAIKNKIAETSAKVQKDTSAKRDIDVDTIGKKSVMKITVKYNGSDKVKNFVIYDKVPKEFAQNASEITVTASGAKVTVVNADPEYMFTYSELAPGASAEISYSVDKVVDTAVVSGTSAPTIFAEETEVISSETGTTTAQPIGNRTWMAIAVILLVIIIAAYYYMNKKGSEIQQ